MRAIEGRLTAILRPAGGGAPVLVRRARNAVLREGAELLAALFTGGGAALDGAMVGLGEEPPAPPYEGGPSITAPDGTPRLLRPATALAPTDFTVETLPEELRVRVAVRALLPATSAVDAQDANRRVEITEASLGVLDAAGTGLARVYNRVIFEPVPKTAAHELALYFEVDFPYGA